nr:MAG TPA: hypothetical protein [Caudoviricetes sp.]
MRILNWRWFGLVEHVGTNPQPRIANQFGGQFQPDMIGIPQPKPYVEGTDHEQ